MLYFRPQAGCATAPDCTQYAPFTHKVLLWDMFPQYQSPAPLRPNDWNHVKVVVSGRRMNVFVNGATSPTLAVGSLEGDAQEGQLALIGPGAFANFTVTPDAVDGLAAEPSADPVAGDKRLVRHWQLAPYSSLADGVEPTAADLPKPSTAWRELTAERGGLVNISRVYGLPVERPTRSLTWLKTTISSEQEPIEESRDRMEPRSLGLRERTAGVCRQEPLSAADGAETAGWPAVAAERFICPAFECGRQ